MILIYLFTLNGKIYIYLVTQKPQQKSPLTSNLGVDFLLNSLLFLIQFQSSNKGNSCLCIY
ncbi:hypothetical protein pb186bvf_001592 [Paramecium bursaria]